MLIIGEILGVLAGPRGLPEEVREFEHGGRIEMNQVKLKTSFLFNAFCSHTFLINQQRLILSALNDAEKMNSLTDLLTGIHYSNQFETEIPEV